MKSAFFNVHYACLIQPFVFQLFQQPLQYVLQAGNVALYACAVVLELFALQVAYNGERRVLHSGTIAEI